ncbi:unnamed protein product [Clonostachys rosea f. rosea IK726]|uniref:Cyclase n=2 Tax=Bionectria ochroleuca TaxID=29856 RepID=A0A0B7JMP4_BIOOC|nr:unnamed protein product [Clonostachys rosea f. rosea IK726]
MPLPTSIPSFDELPLHKGDPIHSAWGLWGTGPESALGSLNYLTDEVVLKTMKEEVKTGERVGLNLPLDLVNPPLLGRVGFEQKVIDKHPRVINDDVITFNTQGSSQWDSLRHFAYQTDKKFYNGTTQEQIHASPRTEINSLQSWTTRNLAGRGVLIDYARYAKRHGISYEAFSAHPITVDDIEAIASEQGVKFAVGDVLFVRTGYVASYKTADQTRRERAAQGKWVGVRQGKATLEWLWKKQFAALASDCPGFEMIPHAEGEGMLHPVVLSGWGTPLGELFDLEGLAILAEKLNRWSFFFTSSPLNYTGAVASPPNATAIM